MSWVLLENEVGAIGREGVAMMKGDPKKNISHCKLSNEKNPGWLGYTRDYTTQLYRDYNKPL